MKSIIYLIVIALLAGASFYLANKPKRSTTEIDRNMFMTDTLKLSEIIYSSPRIEYTLTLLNGEWMIKTDGIKKADPEKVRIFTKYLAGLKVTNIISENPDRFQAYGVDSTGAVVKLKNSDGKLRSFIIGKDDSDRRNTFYREESENTVYTGSLFPRYQLPDSVGGWMIIPEEDLQKNNAE
ncbi:MAG: DUF4340 domain-containing protein [Candidatus Delongbacteria bacterium]|nr:DUF4340 domain-containing protein [Candidatus Delongbacteria bacterium]